MTWLRRSCWRGAWRPSAPGRRSSSTATGSPHRSGPRSCTAGPGRSGGPHVRHGSAARRRGRDPLDVAGLSAARRGGAGRGGAAPYGGGRRPGRRRHRRRDPHPVDLRRPGDAAQGRDGELRGRRPVGRQLGRHQRARPRQPAGAPAMVFSAEHYASIVHNWVCWAAPLHDPVTGVKLGVIDLSTTWDRTHPIGLATARVMARLIEGAMPPRPATTSACPRRSRPRPGDDPPRHRRDLARRPAAAAQPAPDRGARAAGAAPRGASARAAARAALRRPGGDVLDAQGRGVAPARRARRPARVAALPAADAGRTDVELVLAPAAPRSRSVPPSTPTAATCCPAPTRPRSPSWPSTSRSRSARRSSPTRSPTRWCATASWRRTTPRSSRSAWRRSARCGRPHPAVPLLKGRLARLPRARRLQRRLTNG